MHNHFELPLRSVSGSKQRDSIYTSFTHIFDASQTNTDLVIAEALRKTYPDLHLTISSTYDVDYLGFAASGQAIAVPVDNDDALTANLKWKFYAPPAKRIDGGEGALGEEVQFGKYLYTWDGKEFLLYIIIGMQSGYSFKNSYLIGPTKEDDESLMLAAGHYDSELHDEILVFDRHWQKSKELWKSVESSTWDDVILDEGMKKAIMGEIHKFFDSRERYAKLKVPWKRGIIYYGPPGNGKTISIKATMHALSRLPSPIPTLYVRSLSSLGGPEYAISSIFYKARQFAPCYLVFEDLDSIVTDSVRSYFLNEVDGLESNDGILMIGSTNHLERLDPGISKRPSRFDRKYLFPDPDEAQRIEYCKFWRKKLEENQDVEFPEFLDKAIAGITSGFSFAYMQEAFVASLLAIAGQDEGVVNGTEEPGVEPVTGLSPIYNNLYTTTKTFEGPPVAASDSSQPRTPIQSVGHYYRPDEEGMDYTIFHATGAYDCPDTCDGSGAESTAVTEELDHGEIQSIVARQSDYWLGRVQSGCSIPVPSGQNQSIRHALVRYNNGLAPPMFHGQVPCVKAWSLRMDAIYEIAGVGPDHKELEKYVLWRQMKKQVGILRKELEQAENEKEKEKGPRKAKRLGYF